VLTHPIKKTTPLPAVQIRRIVLTAPGVPVNPKYFWPVVIVVLLAAFPSNALVAQQSVVNLSLDETQPIRWLMLRNGSVFSGQISESQGKYTIQINPQTQMTYDANRAWVVADSLNELYEFHRARVRPGDLNSQMEFARWCITQKLWTEAELEIDAMRAAGVADLQLRGPLNRLWCRRQSTIPSQHKAYNGARSERSNRFPPFLSSRTWWRHFLGCPYRRHRFPSQRFQRQPPVYRRLVSSPPRTMRKHLLQS
jgi:hypothetical protein